LSGDGIVKGLQEACSGPDARCKGLLLLAQMSSAGNLLTSAYTESTLAMAKANRDFVFGVS
jgi:hypothetical protein